MSRAIAPLVLSSDQHRQIERWLAALGTPQQVVLRCRIILAVAAGKTERAVAAENGVNRKTVRLWRERFRSYGLQALWEVAPGRGRKPTYDVARVKSVIDATLQTKPKGSTHWSCRTMAAAQGVSKSSVSRIWRSHNIKPHRTETFKLSRDRRFLEKLTDVVGLYLNPPDQAMVLCVDEKSQIQALDRTRPILPLRPGLPERQTHDYKRHGTTTLFAAFNIMTGKVIGSCLPRHRGKEFVKFLNQLEKDVPVDLDVHIILDNYGTHKSALVQTWLKPKKRRRFHFHFTPTSSSWLNQVERWFGLITARMIRRGTFRSVPELEQAIYQWLATWNDKPKAFVWKATADVILDKVLRCREAIAKS
jgi:transposase